MNGLLLGARFRVEDFEDIRVREMEARGEYPNPLEQALMQIGRLSEAQEDALWNWASDLILWESAEERYARTIPNLSPNERKVYDALHQARKSQYDSCVENSQRVLNSAQN